MGEQYVNFEIESLESIKINGKVFIIPEDGVLSLSESSLFATKETPMNAFENELTEKLTDAEQISLLKNMGNSNTIMISTITSIVGGDREKAKEILNLGVKHGVLCRGHNSTWKVTEKMFKERMISKAKLLQEFIVVGKSKPVSDIDHVKQSLQSIKAAKNEGEEEVAYDPEVEGNVKENKQVVNVKPGVPISRQVFTKKKPALSKHLVVNKKRT
jgi:hypothetical protein